MSSKNKRICRLCLKVAKNEFQEINEVVKQILGVLLLKLDLDVTRNPIICEDCMEVAKKCLDFKSTCIDTEKIIVLFSTDRKKTRHRIRDIYEKKVKIMTVMDEHLDICRFCLTLLERNNCMSMDSLMDETMFEMLSEYLPETELNVIENPIICRICQENLESYFMFVTNCVDTEGKIKAYCKEEGTDSTGDVTLSNSLHFLFGYTLQDPEKCYRTYKVKEEPNTFEDIDIVRHEPHNKLMKLEEELDIKEEGINFTENLSEKMLDKHGDTFYPNQLDKDTKPDIFYLETSEDRTEERTFQRQALVKKEDISNRAVSKVNGHESTDMPIDKHVLFADIPKFKMEVKQRRGNLVTNSGASEENLCKYTLRSSKQQFIVKSTNGICEGDLNKQKNNHRKQEDAFTAHMMVHKDASGVKMFKCSLCTYETQRKGSLKSHMLIHRDISEIQMYKCSLCTYEAKRKANLNNHMSVHKNISEMKMYKCSLCSYEFKNNAWLIRHMLVHKNVSEVKMFTCSFCSFETKHKSNLKVHMLIHADISKIKMNKCSLCTFQTKHRSPFKNHMLIHKGISEIKMYKCSLCTYEAKRKDNLKNHMSVHKDISEIKTYKCSLCTYEFKHNAKLLRHMLVHKDVSEVKTFKCSLCPFETKHKYNLKMHMLIHGETSKIKMHKCSLCTFQTRHKSALKNHKLIHTGISEIKMYKCLLCTYEAKRKDNLKSHMAVHKDISEIRAYKCSLCTCEYKRKRDLTRHMIVHRDVSGVKK